jgi:hypothetical protein
MAPLFSEGLFSQGIKPLEGRPQMSLVREWGDLAGIAETRLFQN